MATGLHAPFSKPSLSRGLWSQAKRLLYVGLGPISSLWRRFSTARSKAVRDWEAKYRHKARIDLRQLEGRNAPGNPVNPVAFLSAGLGAFAFIDHSILNPPTAADEPVPTGSAPRLLPEPAAPAADAPAPVAAFARTRDDDRILANAATEPGPAAGPQPSAELSDEEMLARFFAPWRDAPFDPGAGGGRGGVVTPGGPGPAYGTTGAPVGGGYASAPTQGADTTAVPLITPANSGGGPGSPTAAAGPGPAAAGAGTAPGGSGGASAGGFGLSAQAQFVPVPQSVTPDQAAQALPQYGHLPLRFEANRGQTDPSVAFLVHGPGQTLYLTPRQAVLDLQQTTPGANGQPGTVNGTVLRTSFVGANPHPNVVGIDPLPGYTNYFAGTDASQWVTNVPSYGGVVYQDLYPGVDLVYYGNAQGQLEYDLVVSPGSVPDNISFNVAGAQGVQVTPEGALVIHTAQGDVTEQAPRVYQTVPTGTQPVTAAFEMQHGGGVGFSVGPYDPRWPLVIDPSLNFSSYLGGSGADQANSVAVDAQGDAYLVGTTASTNFPTTTGAYQTSNDGGNDAFIAKFNASGTGLIYSTYLGGIGSDLGNTIAVDRLGNAYVTGQAAQGASVHFPTTSNAYQNSTNQGEPWAFMTELSPTGNSLVYSSLLGGQGGSGSDEGYGIAVDASGNVYIAGGTKDNNFPTTSGAFQTTSGGGTDAFVAKFNPSLSGSSSLVYSTYLGGSGTDQAQAVAVDGSGNAYVTGLTKSTNFPTASAYQSSLGSASQAAFLVKLNSAGSAETYGTYLRGTGGSDTGKTTGYGIALDSSNDAFVVGGTSATTFPTTSGVYQSSNAGGTDAFVTKFTSGSTLGYSTYLGGSGDDTAYTVALDSSGDAFIAGNTASTNFPTSKAIQSTNAGGTDAFVTKLLAGGTALAYSTYLGGSSTDDGYGVALDGLSNAYVAGDTQSSNFQTTSGAYQTTNAGGDDAFISKITSWGATAGVLTTDPVQGDTESFGDAMLSPQTGDLQLTNALDFLQSQGSSGTDSSAGLGGTPALVYNSDAVNVLPVVQATLQSDATDGVPTQIQAQLTWNNTAQGWVTFSTTGHSAGDTYAIALQASTAVTSTGFVPWSIEVKATLSGGGTVDLTNSGSALVTTIGTSGGFGPGWSIAGLDRLVTDANNNVMFVYGSGGSRFFQSVSGTANFVSPLNDFGTLTGSGTAGWTYTAKDQTKEYFNTAGYETAITDSDGQSVTYSYNASNLPTLVQAPDGGLTTIAYSGTQATQIQEPGGRTLSLAYSAAGDLTKVTEADGRLRTLAYDSSHRLTNDQWGPLNTTFTYSNSELSQINRGLGSTLTVSPANAVGLATSPAANTSAVLGVLTDALNHATTYTLDGQGRLTQLLTPDSGTQTWNLDLYGQPYSQTDAAGRTSGSIYSYDAGAGDTTGVSNPDGSTSATLYDATFHNPTQLTDTLGRLTTMTYSTSGDLLTTKDPLGDLTTQTWSGGQVQTVTDPLGHVTTYLYNGLRQLTTVIDSLGDRTTYQYDGAGNQTSVQDALGHTTTALFDALGRETVAIDALGNRTTTAYDAIGDVTQVTDPRGIVTDYGYNQLGQLTATTEAAGTAQQAITTLAYDAAGRETASTDPLGHITTSAYDAVGNMTAQTDPTGAVTTYQYDKDNELTAVTDPDGHTTTYGYSSRGLQTQVQDALGNRATTLYDSEGEATVTIDARGARTTMSYDKQGRETQVQDALGDLTTTLYDAAGNVTASIDARGDWTTFQYDALNRQTQVQDALGDLTTTLFDKVGNVTGIIDATGARSTFSFDAAYRQTATTDGLNLTTTTAFDGDGNATAVTDPRGYTTTYQYDSLNRQTQVQDALGDLSTTLYDLAGNVTGTIDARGDRMTLAYDAANRQTAATDALNHTVTTQFDPAGNATAVTDARGFTTTTSFDADNRATRVQDPAGDISTTVYDAAGNVTNTIDPAGDKSTMAYDLLGRLTVSTDPRGGMTTQLYDAASNLTTVIDPVGNRTTFAFDAVNRRTKMTDPLNHSATTAYDGDGRVTSTTDRDGNVINTAYDADGRLTAQTWIQSGSTVNNLTFTYDNDGDQLTARDSHGAYTMAYDALDRMTARQEPFGLTLTMAYDAAGDRTQVQDSFGGVLTSVYDAADRLTTWEFGGQGQTTLRIDIGYNVVNEITSLTRYSDLAGSNKVGSSAYSFDKVERVTNIQNDNGSGNVLANYTYAWDAASRLTQKTENGTATTYTYDADSELTASGGTVYSYDANGNRNSSGYTTTAGNEMTNDGLWTYTYDNNGDLTQKAQGGSTGVTWAYTYNNLNQMTTAKETTNSTGATLVQATYTYDVYSNRVEEDVYQSGATTVTRYGYDGTNMWAALTSSNALQTRYIYGDQADQIFARISGGGAAAWYLTDYQGSVRNMTDASGTLQDTIAYDAYGQVPTGGESNTSFGDLFKYAGGQVDSASGLEKFGWRYYDPYRGDWTSQDPTGLAAGDPNLYRYAGNGPTDATDPRGLKPRLSDETVVGPVGGKYGAFLWAINWKVKTQRWDVGVILQRVTIRYKLRRQGSPIKHSSLDGDWHPYHWGADKEGNQQPLQTVGSVISATNPQDPNEPWPPVVSYYEIWPVDQLGWQPGKELPQPTALAPSIVSRLQAQGVKFDGSSKAEDWWGLFAPSSEQRAGKPFTDTTGTIVYDGMAWFFEALTREDLTGKGPKPGGISFRKYAKSLSHKGVFS